jgi:hypothetical protein
MVACAGNSGEIADKTHAQFHLCTSRPHVSYWGWHVESNWFGPFCIPGIFAVPFTLSKRRMPGSHGRRLVHLEPVGQFLLRQAPSLP